MRSEKGFALVLTLVVTALMVAVVAEMIHQVYVDTSLSRGFRDGQQASLLAESGITGGAKLLQFVLQGKEYTALSDKWAAPLKLDDATGSIQISTVEESGKININGVLDDNTMKALKRLGKRLQIPEECWSALADWRDSDNETRSGGAETPYYKILKPPYASRNGKLKTLAELSLVKGFTPEMVAKLRPFVTVYDDQLNLPRPLININTAPREVVAALDDQIDDRMTEKILEERRLQPFKAPGELSRAVEPQLANSLSRDVSIKGNVYRVTAVARVKESARTVEAVLRLTSGGALPEILSWQEY